MENVSLNNVRTNVWIRHEGGPAHHAVGVQEILNMRYQNKQTGHGGLLYCLAVSPDLTSIDFFLQGYIKSQVFVELPTNPDNMKETTCLVNTPLNMFTEFLVDLVNCYIRQGKIKFRNCTSFFQRSLALQYFLLSKTCF